MLLVLLVLSVAFAGCAPQVSIELSLATDLTVPPNFVKFQVGERLKFPEVYEFGPFDVNAIPNEQFAQVPPETEFYVDAIGCSGGTAPDCATGGDFTARGCTGFLVLARDEVTTIPVQLHLPNIGDETCPPPDGNGP